MERVNTQATPHLKCASKLAFVAGLWPVMLVFFVGPLGTMVSRWSFDKTIFNVQTLILLFLYIAIYAGAALWAIGPLFRALSCSGVEASGLETHKALSALPLRVGKAFLIVGCLLATGLILFVPPSASGEIPPMPAGLVATLAFTLYFAFGIVTTALGVSRAIVFTMRLRKEMSMRSEAEFVQPEGGFQCVLLSVSKRPWVIFIITGALPLALMASYSIVARGLTDPIHKEINIAQVSTMFFGVMICATYLVHTLRQNLQMVFTELDRGMESIRDGDFTNRIAVLIDDETGKVAKSLNTALSGLKEREDLKDSLAIAAEIQRGMLPELVPSFTGYEMDAFQESSYGVGGDFYDFIELDNGRLWVIVADVSGKGYPAALTVATLHATLHTLADTGTPFRKLPSFINDSLASSMTQGRFVTAFMAELRADSPVFDWFNAGHTQTVVASGTGTYMLESTGLPFGVLPGSKAAVKSNSFEPGDMLLTYSDGVSELRKNGGHKSDMYGVEGVSGFLMKAKGSAANGSSKTFSKNFLNELAAFGEVASDDDLTFLMLARAIEKDH